VGSHWCPTAEAVLQPLAAVFLAGIPVLVPNGLARSIFEKRYIERPMSDDVVFHTFPEY
jgi:hypothetical protein